MRDRVPGAPPEKMKFRCLGCNALLSVAPVGKRSKLTCPQCKTGMYIEPNGSVEPVHKVAQPAGQQKEGAPDEPPLIFDKKELDKMLSMDMEEKKGPAFSDETADIPSATAPPPPKLQKKEESTGEIPPTRGIQKPKKQPPKLKIQPRSRLDQYKKIAAGLPAAKENKPLLIIAVVLLALPGIFALVVTHSDLGKGLRERFVSPADTLREGVKRVMENIGVAPASGGGEEEEAAPEEKKEEAAPKEEEKEPASQPEGEEEKKTEEGTGESKTEKPSEIKKPEEPTTPEEKKPEEGKDEKESDTPETPPKTE